MSFAHEQHQLTYEDYLERVRLVRAAHPEWRIGQAYFNQLYLDRSDISEQIRGTKFDPFYRASILTEFLEEVKRLWDLGEDRE